MTDRASRIQSLYGDYFQANAERTDRMFGVLLVIQYIAGVLGAIYISPFTWSGHESSIHLHVYASIIFGLIAISAPLYLIGYHRGRPITRYTIAVAQMLFGTLFIHISGGRIETHFHVFGSLAFLAFYRDWRVLIPATIVVASDHLLRGLFWPQSVFGVLTSSPWRAFEHTGWVLFEVVFLTYSCIQSSRELKLMGATQIDLEESRDNIERKVKLRTSQLEASNIALRESEERYALAIRGTQEAVWDWDITNNTVYYGPNWTNLLGLSSQKELTDSPDEWFSRITSNHLSSFHNQLGTFLEMVETCFESEFEMAHTDGKPRWIRCRAAACRNEYGYATRLTGSLADITELKEAQENLRHLAEYDQLTDLPNRDCFYHELRKAIDQFSDKQQYSVAFFDFDRFKVINDSLGHNVGDALLKNIARLFKENVNSRDVVSRFGGDEFVLLICHDGDHAQAQAACDRLLEVFAQPHQIEGHQIVSTASIGLVHGNAEYHTPEEVIRDADVAMYRAKSEGRNSCRVFDEAMHSEAIERLQMESDLREAIAEQQFELYYQPIVSTVDARVVGFESLLRWHHPQKGTLSPNVFMEIAEETGLIDDLGRWIFEQAIKQIAVWNRLPGHEQLMVSVNLSRRQLINPYLIDDLKRILETTQVDPRNIYIEITESCIMDQRYDALTILNNIRELGFKLAIDDFGTGHSSLSCLHEYPIDILKIDQSFINNLGRRKVFSAVLDSIVSLGHHLNMKIIGEGVETFDQLVQLQALECALAQGYYFERPIRVDDATQLLHSTPHWVNVV